MSFAMKQQPIAYYARRTLTRYSLCRQCCSQIANSPKAQAQKKKENTKIGQWAAQCISEK